MEPDISCESFPKDSYTACLSRYDNTIIYMNSYVWGLVTTNTNSIPHRAMPGYTNVHFVSKTRYVPILLQSSIKDFQLVGKAHTAFSKRAICNLDGPAFFIVKSYVIHKSYSSLRFLPTRHSIYSSVHDNLFVLASDMPKDSPSHWNK